MYRNVVYTLDIQRILCFSRESLALLHSSTGTITTQDNVEKPQFLPSFTFAQGYIIIYFNFELQKMF